mgnify:CR=1 FL=1
MESLKTYTFGPASGSAPKQLVILLHGLGANGQDLIGLAPYLAQAAPDAIFVSPDAPYPCDMAPFGYQWFSLQDRTPEVMLKGVQEAAPVVDHFITEQFEKYGLEAKDTVLGGFSQGCMMSLYAGPRYPEKLAGIMGFSGALLWESSFDFNGLQKIPVNLVHGDADEVVPVGAYHHAKETLEKAGFAVGGHTTPGLGHGIDENGIRSGCELLQRVFGS